MNSCKIYLADLVHNYVSKGPHTFPINVGYIASYAKKCYGDKVQVKLFKYPLDLINAIKQDKPHIVGLSNYTWNLDINNKVISWIKSQSRDIVTVYGGPDYPIGSEEVLRYLKERSDLDFYVLNQGERGFVNIIEKYFSCNSINEMKMMPVENCSFYDRNRNEIIISDTYKYIEDLEEIPSPYLSGIMNEFFGYNLIPLIETNRGCPYSCTYCAWGNSSKKKVFSFPLERVKEEIEYIAKKVEKTDLLFCGDANFGIFERDVEIAKFMRYVKDVYGYPKSICVAWAKTAPHRIIKMAETLGDIVGIASPFGSFQSMDSTVTKNIKRTNMSTNEFKKIQDHFMAKGISFSSELILGLPGETRETHLNGLKSLFDYNTAAIVCYNLRMLGGTELNTNENRRKFDIKTKYRLIDGGFGKYDDIVSIEHEEMALHTSTMKMEDILYMRPIHFLIQLFWNYKYYAELLIYLKEEGISPVDFIIKIVNDRHAAPSCVKNRFEDFIREAYEEWFDTKRSLIEYYSRPENFKSICEGDFGKLNYKYMYRFLLEGKKDFDQYLFSTAVNMLAGDGEVNGAKREQLDNLQMFTENVCIDFANGFKGVATEKISEYEYDILKWKREVGKRPLSEYRCPHGVRLNFTLPNEQISVLKKLYEQFKKEDLNQTLRKMVEYMNERDLFYKVDYA